MSNNQNKVVKLRNKNKMYKKALEYAASDYLGKFDDCRLCSFEYECKVRNQNEVDECMDTVIKGWKERGKCDVEYDC